jgi:hypothetical protein
MSNARERIGAAGVALASLIFKIAFYACVLVLFVWLAKANCQPFSSAIFITGESSLTVTVCQASGVFTLKLNRIFFFWVLLYSKTAEANLSFAD